MTPTLDPSQISWTSIWSSFISRPRTRQWLLNNNPPTSDEVVQGLLSNPVICAYVPLTSPTPFTPIPATTETSTIPPTGDVRSVVRRDGDILLGLSFDFDMSSPYMTVLYDMVGDDTLSPRVKVVSRRSAYRSVILADGEVDGVFVGGSTVILCIDCDWMTSGVTAICIRVLPMSGPIFLSQYHIRYFPKQYAEALRTCSGTLFFSTTDSQHRVVSERDIVASEKSHEDGDILPAALKTPSGMRYCIDLEEVDVIGHPRTEDVPPFEPEGSAVDAITCGQWRRFLQVAARSKGSGAMRNKVWMSLQDRGEGGSNSMMVKLVDSTMYYVLYIAYGGAVTERVQRVCAQMGIDCTSPGPGVGPRESFENQVVGAILETRIDGNSGDLSQSTNVLKFLGGNLETGAQNIELEAPETNSESRNGDFLRQVPPTLQNVYALEGALTSLPLHISLPASALTQSKNTITHQPIRKPSQQVWQCDECGIQTRGKRANLLRHIALKHRKERRFACRFCGTRFQLQMNATRHEETVHSARRLVCGECSRSFLTAHALEKHEVAAHQEAGRRWECEVCGGCYPRANALLRHREKVHGDVGK